MPFKIVEYVARTWEFSAELDEQGTLILVADGDSETVDWDSGIEMLFQCAQCSGDFPMREAVSVDFG